MSIKHYTEVRFRWSIVEGEWRAVSEALYLQVEGVDIDKIGELLIDKNPIIRKLAKGRLEALTSTK